MSHPHKHFVIQGVILILWILIVVLPQIDIKAHAQLNCPSIKYLAPLPGWSWRPFRTVTVRIDDGWDEPDRLAIADGNLKWHGSNCSGVEFVDFSPKTFTLSEYNSDPPDDTVYWQRIDPQNNGAAGGVFYKFDIFNRVKAARIKIDPRLTNTNSGTHYIWLGAHEVGHTFNLADCLCVNQCSCVGEVSVMSGHGSISFNSNVPTQCDFLFVNDIYCPVTPTPTPTPLWPWPDPTPPNNEDECATGGWFWNFSNGVCSEQQVYCPHHCVPYQPLESGGCNHAADYCAFPYGCPPETVDGGQGCCCFPTPILIDVKGDGFALTDAYSGVMFDMGGDGKPEPVAWTTGTSDDAWLVLDRNGNGQIDNGKELFGNFTDQPTAAATRNGFLAMAEFDKLVAGGNGDGIISSTDTVFSSLRLWQDINHNGVADTSELHTLEQFGLKTIELHYSESKRIDPFGNQFKYRAKVKDNRDAQLGRWAWDVILTANPPGKKY